MAATGRLTARATAVRVLRATHTLNAVDAIRLVALSARSAPANRRFRRDHPGFTLPPPSISFDAYGHVRGDWYHITGRRTAEQVAKLIGHHANPPVGRPMVVLDWGCGAARVVRHLVDGLAWESEIHGTDFNPRSIEWCRLNIPGVRFALNGLAPPLDFPAESFDCVYGLSVLTHLSEPLHYAWRDEMVRVLRPGGVLLLTTNGDDLREAHLGAVERARYDSGELVVRGGAPEGKKWFTAYHSPGFIRERFRGPLEIVEHVAEHEPPRIQQDIWVFRKPT